MSTAVKQFHEEEAIGKTYDFQVARRLLRYLKPYARYLVLAILLDRKGASRTVDSLDFELWRPLVQANAGGAYGRLDVLVTSAGITSDRYLVAIDPVSVNAVDATWVKTTATEQTLAFPRAKKRSGQLGCAPAPDVSTSSMSCQTRLPRSSTGTLKRATSCLPPAKTRTSNSQSASIEKNWPCAW